MIIEIARIPPEGKTFVGEEPPSIFDIEDKVDLKVEGPVHYELDVRVVSNELIVKGTLKVDMSFGCSRCGEFFSLPVAEPLFQYVAEIGNRALRAGLGEARSATSTSSGQAGSGQAGQVESVDLTEDIRESMILAFPDYPVCKPDCKGLCPLCGMNLNKSQCNCKPPGDDIRWSALDNLNG